MRKNTFLILSVFILSSLLTADTLSLSFFQNTTDNLFQNKFGESDQLSNLSFYIDKNLSRFSLFTQGNYSYLFENPDLTYYVHDLGMDYIHPVNEKSAFYLSFTGRGAFYQKDYSDFNYFSMNFFLAFKTYLSQTSILKSNYSFEFKNYNSSFFDFVNHSIFLSLDKYLQTKTTLKTEMNWGLKYFLHPYFTQESISLGETQFYFNGNGKGNNHKRMSNQFITRPVSEGQEIQVFSISGLVAQGIGNNLGLRFTGMKQWTLSGKNPFTFIEEFYAVENPSYDKFSWEGYLIGSQLTILAPWNIQIKMGYTISDKEFPGIESLDSEGNFLGITRKDIRKQFEARVEKNFRRFSLFLSYFKINNNSNDSFFEWNGQFFSAGIEWNLSFGGGN